jgi:Gpi18-like mannosyltransferase
VAPCLKYVKGYVRVDSMKKILYLFLTWRAFLFVTLFLGLSILPLQPNFIGGGLTNYLHAPYLWGWSNFDGEHYLNIAQNGYGYGEQAFFPLYPWLIKSISTFLGHSLFSYNLIGLVLSNTTFFIALWGLYKLARLDYDENVTTLFLLLLLFFPTSFYFGSVYTESLFLALTVWSFYFARKKRWFSASILGGVSSATRVLGIFLFPVLLIEFWSGKEKKNWRDLLPLLIIPLGLFSYMYYSYVNFDDPLKFVHVLPTFGEQRQITPVVLPQVFYRYIFKIFPNINYHYFPVVFTTFLEFAVATLFLVLVILTFYKTRLSYAVFSLLAYLIPTFSGSFSSLPRYVIVIFPAFMVLAMYIKKVSKAWGGIIFVFLLLCLTIATALFTRGFWVS